MTTLLPFHTELSNAWKLFLRRWGSAVLLQVLILIPGALMFPFASEYLIAIQNGVDPTGILQTSLYTSQFIVGYCLFILVEIFIAASTGILFAAQEKISFLRAFLGGIVRYIPVLYTTILSAFIVTLSLIPAFALNYWYASFAETGATTISDTGIMAVDLIVIIALVALLIPAFIIMVWVMYAPLAVALKAAPAGFTAIMFSKHLMHRHVWQVVWRMVGVMALFQIISASVSTLPYASYLVPFILTILALAFFVEVYKELHQEQA